MMTEKKIIMGYDNSGIVYDNGDAITREVFDNYLIQAKEIYEIYHKNSLDKLGIVETTFDYANNIFIHKKYTITYPYEWSANMIKDAVLHHLKLFIELDKYDLFLKDAHLNNILFDYRQPVFVDFLSVIPKNKLVEDDSYRQTRKDLDPRFSVIHRMLTPYVIIPYFAMAIKNYSLARKIMIDKACNCTSEIPDWKDIITTAVYHPTYYEKIKAIIKGGSKNKFKTDPAQVLINKYNKIEKQKDFLEFVKKTLILVSELDVTPPKSGGGTYYEDKGELYDFSDKTDWKEKQKSVFEILLNHKPKSVLDIGANTGWFSLLSERMGASVIATDIDEFSIDMLYLLVKEKNLKIIPLHLPLGNFTKEIFGLTFNEPKYENRNFNSSPIYTSPVNRLQSDLVLCLALIHHLVLGEGKSFEYIFDIFFKITNKTLVLEFVDINDKLVKDVPGFFRNIKEYSLANYNINIVIETGLRYFKTYEILNSNPETRKVIVFNK